MNGGIAEAYGFANECMIKNNNGPTSKGVAVAIAQHTTKQPINVIINDGTLEFVADATQRDELRAEKYDQAENAYETAKSIGNELAADFMLQGTVTTIVDTEGKQQVRTYQVDMQLIDLETNKIIWADQNNDIRKYIKRPSAKF